MNKKVRLCLALFLALAVLVQYSFTPQALVAYGLDNTDKAVQTEEAAGDDGQTADTQEATELAEDAKATEPAEDAKATEPTESTETTKPADEDKTPAGEEKDADKQDVKYPAASFSKTAGDVKVNISAPEGALPEGTTVKIEDLGFFQMSKVKSAVKEELGKKTTVVKAVDITFFDKDGKEIEPQEKVSVTFASKEFNDLDNAQVVHINNDGDAEKVKDSQVDGNKATFKSNEFSIYAVVETVVPRLTLKFMNNLNDSSSGVEMIVKAADTAEELEYIIYDPGIEGINESQGEVFRGWTTTQPITSETTGTTIAQIRTAAKTEASSLTADKTIIYYPIIYKQIKINYLDENEASLGTHVIDIPRSSDMSAEYTVNMPYTPVDNEHNFEGWTVYSGKDNIEGYTEGKLYVNEVDTITVTGDVTFSVNSPEGHWLTFDENGKGATFNAPVFIKNGETTSKPVQDDEMNRNGHTFKGWFKTKTAADNNDQSQLFQFGQTISDHTTVYAGWLANSNADYTVIIWKQNVKGKDEEGNKIYDYAEAIKIERATVGSTPNVVRGTSGQASATVNGTTKSWTGFHFDSTDQSAQTVAPEGNTIVNVYFDRNEYTLTFNDPGSNYISYVYGDGIDSDATVGNAITNNNNIATLESNKRTTNGYEVSYYGNNNRTYAIKIDGTWRQITRYGVYVYNSSMIVALPRAASSVQIKALYEQNIADNFPIVGTNGYTYNHGERWKPGNNNVGFSEVMIYIDSMPAGNVTFTLDLAARSTKYMHLYVEVLPGQTPERTYKGKGFVKYNDKQPIAANYGFFTAEDNVELLGFETYGTDPDWDSNGHINAENVYFYYTRNTYDINFFDGSYYDGNNSRQNTGSGEFTSLAVKDVYYNQDLTSYNKGNDNYNAIIPTIDDKNYTFAGWYVDKECTHEYTFSTMPEGGLTLYAKWIRTQYRVFVHPKAGTDPTLDWGTGDEDPTLCFRVDSEGEKVSITTPRRTGYEFVGWFTDENCTKVFNPNVYILNDTTVGRDGSDYDMTVTMTDKINKWGDYYDEPTPYNTDINGYKQSQADEGSPRFWITKKLDVYGAWRSVIEGADGINIKYVADGVDGDGTAVDGVDSSAPSDSGIYVDGAKVTAGKAAKPTDTDTYKFDCWIVQKYNETTEKYEDTNVTVEPGAKFDAKVAYAKKEVDQDHSTATETRYTYTIQLRAKYKKAEEATPTAIYWYANGGNSDSGDLITDDKDGTLKINEGVNVRPSTTFTRAGYVFKGWARVPAPLNEDGSVNVDGFEQNDDVNPWLVWDGSSFKEGNNTVNQVAADEKNPYQALYAVWEENEVTINYVVASDSTGKGTVSTGFETIKAVTGTAAGSTATPSSNEYVFDYWTCDVDDAAATHISSNATFVPSKNNNNVYEAHTYYAHFKLNKANVTVHHYLKGTTTKVAEDVTSSETIGSEYTAEPVITYQEKNLTVDSYDPSQKVTVSADGNVITIYYTLPLTITAKSDSKTYDGTPLSGAYTITGALENDSATIENALGNAPSITNAADSPKNYLTVDDQTTITGIPSYYAVTYTPGTLTITKRPVTFKGETATKEYTGSEIELTGITRSSGENQGLVSGHTDNVTYSAKGTEVGGPYSGTITAKENVVIKKGEVDVTANYDITVDNGALTIVQDPDKTFTVSLESAEYVYDGLPHNLTKAATADAASGSTTILYKKSTDGENAWTADLASLTATAVADSCTIQVKAINPNYKDAAESSATLTIKKRPVTFTGQTDARTYTGSEIELTDVTVSTGENEGLVSGHSHNVKYSAKGTEVGEYDGTITSKENVVIFAGETDLTANYTVTTIPGKLTIEQTTETLTVSLESKSYVYDAQAHSLPAAATTNAASGTTTIEYSKDGESWVANLSNLTAITVADSCTIQVRATNPNYKNTATSSATLTITARPITFTGETATETYTGTEIELTDVTRSTGANQGLVSGHSDNVTYSAKGTEVGQYPGTITAQNDVVIKAGEEDVTANYSITTTPGTLTITQTDVELTVSLGSKSFVYDAEAHSLPATATTNAASGTTTIEYSTDGENWVADLSNLTARTVADSCTIQVRATNPNYKNTATSSATLTITARPITFTGESATKTYSGTEIELTGITRSEGEKQGLVSGHTDNVTYSAKGTEVGEYDGTITAKADVVIMAGNENVTANYDITVVNGKLTIEQTDEELTVSLDGATYVYDGEAHVLTTAAETNAVSGATKIEYQEDDLIHILWTEDLSSISATDVGEYTIRVRATNPNYKNIATAEAVLKITARPVTFTGETATKTYTGSEIKLTGITKSSGENEGLVSGHSDNVAYSAKGTDVGEYDGTITAKSDVVILSGDKNVTANYDITVVNGKLMIEQTDEKLTVSLGSESYVYDAQAHSLPAVATTNAKSGTTTILYKKSTDADNAWTTDLASLTATRVADSCTIQVKATNPNYKNTAESSATLTITKRPVTFTGKTDERAFTGSEIELTEVTPTTPTDEAGLVNGHTHNVTYSAKGTEVGEYDGTITAKDDVVIMAGNLDVTANYDITVVNGKLTIVKNADLKLTVSLDGEAFVYDGNKHALSKEATTNAASGKTTIEYSVDGENWTTALSSLTATTVADSCTIQVRATNPNYDNTATSSAELNITKRPVTFTGDTATKTYTGREIELTGIIKSSGEDEGLVTGHVDNVKYSAKGTNVGDYTGTITDEEEVVIMAGNANVTANYNITTTPGVLTIEQTNEELTVSLEGATYVYDGEAHSLTTAAETNAASGTTTIEYSKDGENWTTDLSDLKAINVADSCTIQVRATNPNYKNTATSSATLTITARPITFTGESATKTYSGTEIELTGITRSEGEKQGLVSGHTDNVTYSAKGTEVGEYDGTITAKADVVIMAGNENVTANYDITVVNGKLTIEQTDEELTVSLNDATYVYDGKAHSLSDASTNAKSGTTTIEYKKAGLLNSWTTDLSSLTATAVADSCTIQVRATNPNYKNTATAEASLTITARPVTFTGESATKTYTGSEIKLTGVTKSSGENEGLVSGHSDNVAYSAKGTDVGEYDGTITAKEAVVITANGKDVTANYIITTTPGKLTIEQTDEELTVSLDGATYVYDGEAHSLEPAETNAKSGNTVIQYSKDGESWTTDLSSLTATAVADSCTIQVRATNPNYKNTATSSATLTITTRHVTFTGETAERAFTGNAIELTKVTPTTPTDDTGLVSGHTHNVKYSAKGTDVGEYEGTITDKDDVVIMAGNMDVTANYDITVVNGKLTIVKNADLKLTVSLDGEAFVYDGNKHALSKEATTNAASGKTTIEYSLDGENWTTDLSSLTATTVADSCTIQVRATNPNYDNNATSSASLNITKRGVTLRSASASKTYDGTALTSHSVRIVSGSFVKGEEPTYKFTGTQTAVGSSPNTFDVVMSGNVNGAQISALAFNASNYNITKEYGTLTVTAAPTPPPTPTPGGGGNNPNRGGGNPGVAAANPAPAAPATITDNPTPTTIVEEPTPKAATAYWALINLLCAIATALLSLIMLIRYFGRRKDENEQTGEEESTQRGGLARIASLVPAIGAIIAFILTEDMSLPMAMVDKWTILMIVILAIQAGVGIVAKLRDDDEEESDDEAMA